MPDGKNVGAISRWWAAPALAIGFLLFWSVSRLSTIAAAEAAGISAATIIIMTRAGWSHHSESWFWPSITAVGLAHVIAIVLFPWPSDHKVSKSDLLFIWPDAFLYI